MIQIKRGIVVLLGNEAFNLIMFKEMVLKVVLLCYV